MSQPNAQAKYEQCASDIASYNQGIDAAKVKSLDIYGLDGDKDGIVCEALPGAPKNTELTPSPAETETATGSKTSPARKKPTTNRSTPKPSTNTYSRTPIENSTEPFPITEATVRTNPKTLPAN